MIGRRGVLALGGVAALMGLAGCRIGARGAFAARLARDFGPGIAGSPAAAAFLDDFTAARGYGTWAWAVFTLRPVLFGETADDVEVEMRRMLFAFLHSTNAARLEPEGTLDYSGLFDPYAAPCSNRLSANWE